MVAIKSEEQELGALAQQSSHCKQKSTLLYTSDKQIWLANTAV